MVSYDFSHPDYAVFLFVAQARVAYSESSGFTRRRGFLSTLPLSATDIAMLSLNTWKNTSCRYEGTEKVPF